MNWILCPVRNGLHYTKDAVADFLAQDIGNVGVLMIDNDSADGTGRWLSAQREALHVIHNRPGKSVAESWNQGLEWVFSQDGDKCLVVNNDVRLRPDTYRHLAEDGGDFVTAVGSKDEECLTAEPTLQDGKRPHPDFSCFLIRRAVRDKVGEFDELFAGAYCEDADYHLRMHKAGVEAYCIGLPFLHYASGTLESASEEVADEIRAKADANRKLFESMWGFAVGSDEYYQEFE